MSANSDRLERIRQSLRRTPLSLSIAEEITREFAALSQDSADVLVFFVLKHVFSEISRLLDGEAVSVDRHFELTEETRKRTLDLLDRTDFSDSGCLMEVADLVEAHIIHASLFRNAP